MENRWSWRVLIAGVPSMLAVALVPAGRINDAVIVTLSVAMVVLIVLGARSHRPRGITGWYLLALCCLISLMGQTARLAGASPDVFVALDGAATAGSLLTGGLGIAILARQRGRSSWDAATLLDFVIVVTACGLVVLGLLFGQRDRSGIGYQEAGALIGCLAAVGVVTLIVRMLSGKSSTFATRSLGLAVVCGIASGALSGLGVQSWTLPGVTQLLTELLVAVAALHSSMVKISEPAPKTIREFTIIRMLLIAAALLVSSLIAAINTYEATGNVDVVWLGGSVVIALGTGLRVRTLLAERDGARRQVVERGDRLRSLADFGQQMLEANTPSDVISGATQAVGSVLGSDTAFWERRPDGQLNRRSFFSAATSAVATVLSPDGDAVEANDGSRAEVQALGEHVVVSTGLDPADTRRTHAIRLGTNAEVFGVLATYPAQDAAAEHDDIAREFITQIATMAAMTLQRMSAEQNLRQAQKLEAVGRLAAGLAHEMNSPLQFLDNNVRFLESSFSTAAEQSESPDADEMEFLREEVPKSVREALDGLRRVGDIVRVMKLIGDPPSKDKVSVDVNELVTNVVTITRHQLADGAAVDVQLDATADALCNTSELVEALIAVLMNANEEVKAAYPEDPAKRRVSIRTSSDEAVVRIAIRDNGRGIPEAVRSRVWEQFFTTKAVGSGMGLGLAMARSHIEGTGGTIDFVTNDEGTTFTVELATSGR